MNNFTKEELMHLFGWAVSLADLLPNTFCESDVNLYNKLHSMIDNYCEHEWYNNHCSCVLTNFDCTKCGKIHE